MRWLAVVVASLAVAVLASVTHRATLELGPTGQDTVILVASSQVHSLDDLRTLCTQELRRGIRPTTAFYRPLVNLSFAVDEWVADSSWRQLHRSSVAWHSLASVALLLLMLRLGLPLSWSVAGAAVFALHPLAIEVVPAPARRGESMVVAWLALSAALWREDASNARKAVAILLAALAPLVKETAFVLPLLWAALPEGRRVRSLLVGLAAVLPALLLRTVVLVGAGGYRSWSVETRGLVDTLLDLFDVYRLSGGWGVRLLVLVLFAAAVHRCRSRRVHEPWIFGAVWMGASLALLPLARGIAAWYAYLPLAGAVILIVSLGRELIRAEDRRVRAGAWLLLGLFALLALRTSPLWTDYPEWRWIGEESARVLEVSRASPELGDAHEVIVAGLPREAVARPPRRFPVRSATGVVADTLRAWWQWQRGVDVPVQSLVDLALHGPRSRPTRAVTASDETRIYAPPGARLVLPMWPVEAGVSLSASGSAAHVQAAAMSPAWLWTCGEWVELE